MLERVRGHDIIPSFIQTFNLLLGTPLDSMCIKANLKVTDETEDIRCRVSAYSVHPTYVGEEYTRYVSEGPTRVV